MKKSIFAAVSVAAMVVGGAASAATFSIVDTDDTSFDFILGSGTAYNPTGTEAANLNGSSVRVFNSSTDGGSLGGGLYIDDNARISVEFLGKEAGYENKYVELESDGQTQRLFNTDAIGDFFTYNQTGPGFVDFKFVSQGNSALVNQRDRLFNGGISESTGLDLGILLDNNSTTAYLMFGDGGGNNDFDLDDMVMRLDIQPVPLPASSLLLLAGIGGLAAMKRRK